MIHRLAGLVLVSALASATPGWAEEAQATAPVVTSAPIEDDAIEAYLRDLPPPTEVTPTYGPLAFEPDRRAHGEVSVAVGNHGYRSVYARQSMPVGRTGTVELAVRSGRFNGRAGPRSTTDLGLSLDFSGAQRCRDYNDIPPWRRSGVEMRACDYPLRAGAPGR